MPMTLKTVDVDGKTYAEIQDGKPVYVDDGKEIPFDAPATVTTINRITDESKGYKTRAQTAEDKLKGFEGIDDPAAAKKALETVANLDHKKLIDAGEVDKVKAEAIKAVEEKYAPIVKERDDLQAALHGEKIGGSFARSKAIADKFAIPADLVQARFGQNFKLEDGKVVAYDQTGNKLFSKARPGELAEFDEALDLLVDAYPYKDQILKGQVKDGGGAHNQNPNNANGADTSKLSPVDRINASRGVTT